MRLLTEILIVWAIIYALFFTAFYGWELDVVKSEVDPGCCLSEQAYVTFYDKYND